MPRPGLPGHLQRLLVDGRGRNGVHGALKGQFHRLPYVLDGGAARVSARLPDRKLLRPHVGQVDYRHRTARVVPRPGYRLERHVRAVRERALCALQHCQIPHHDRHRAVLHHRGVQGLQYYLRPDPARGHLNSRPPRSTSQWYQIIFPAQPLFSKKVVSSQ